MSTEGVSQSDWIKSLKVGDLVAVESRRRNYIGRVQGIERGCVMAFGMKFNRKGLHKDDFWTSRLLPATPELIAECKDIDIRERTIRRLRSMDWEKVPADKLAEIVALLNLKG